MGKDTKIEWCDHTFSPWHGCTEVSPACDNCYARVFSQRIGYSETGSKFPIWGKDTPRRFFGDKHWDEPRKWNRDAAKAGVRKRVFCGSMCDVMEDYNGTEHLVRETIEESRRWLYRLIEDTPNLDWLLLTKRPQNFRRFLPHAWLDYPRPNVWGMTTVESAEYLWRIAALENTPFIVRGLSVEPLLSELNLVPYLKGGMINWVIVGGESGPGARPMHPFWVRYLRDQCVDYGVAFHFKQFGDWQVGSSPNRRHDRVLCNDGVLLGIDLADTTYEVRTNWSSLDPTVVSRVGKHVAGRVLDGRTWDEFPSVTTKEAA